ncbi:membrane protein [Actinorhabdospora filicis]|uniref:Membrane protein n=1 Tax=Actinorhabdospora filicis TaxID=1785913 RepID=A0A9W6WDE8_9ACTN|nr:YcnI family protein [Actinorhabdospora filicis]GLZ82028.1 membrane protein [Actinorhabdospora filicis]
MRVLKRLTAVAGLALIGVLTMAGAASAHVTINPGQVQAGSYARVDLRVPNESDTASTVKIELTLPEQYPFASVRTTPIAGWKVETAKRTLTTPLDVHGRQITEAVSTVTWTAENAAAGVQPGQFVEFGLSLGPVPDVAGSTLIFKAIQTYSDGEEAAWIADPPAAGAEEPENPAPALKVVAGSGDEHADQPSATAPEAKDADENDTVSLVIASVAGVLAIAAITLAVAAFRSARAPK